MTVDDEPTQPHEDADRTSDAPDTSPEEQPTAVHEDRDAPEPTKVCPRCSVQSQTSGEFCPHCGAKYMHGRKGLGAVSKRTKIIAAAVVAVIVLAGGGVAIAEKISHDDQVTQDKERAEAAAKAAAAQKAQEQKAADAEAAAQEESDNSERALRRELVREMESSIKKDALKRVNEGTLTGPIKKVSCNPVGGGSESDLADKTGRYDCIAVDKTNSDGTESGYPFKATANWDEFSYTWQLDLG